MYIQQQLKKYIFGLQNLMTVIGPMHGPYQISYNNFKLLMTFLNKMEREAECEILCWTSCEEVI